MQDSGQADVPASQATPSWLNRTVLGAGITSALGDLTYETTNVILPGFLAVLGLPAAVLGTVEGVADGLSSFTKLGAGYLADRFDRRHQRSNDRGPFTAVRADFERDRRPADAAQPGRPSAQRQDHGQHQRRPARRLGAAEEQLGSPA